MQCVITSIKAIPLKYNLLFVLDNFVFIVLVAYIRK